MDIINITDRITRIVVRLPDNPLKTLNSYIITGNDRNLLIDTGFHVQESFSDLKEGIRALEIDMGQTDIFLTHCHSDHAGNAGRIASPDSVIYASETDKDLIASIVGDHDGLERYFFRQMVEQGFPADSSEESLEVNPALQNNEPDPFPVVPIDEGHVFDLGGVRLGTVSTPGHTPGHTCLYIEEDGILFTGDHVLFDITPNITEWSIMDDALGVYLESLRKVRGMDVRLALPGHRESGCFASRIDALLDHHKSRLEEALNIVAAKDGQTCYEIASQMTWKIRHNNWSEFPLSQIYFAVGEAASHLRHLVVCGDVRVEKREGVNRYYV
ncbi:MAG: MBL fold metallo-hydrolase [Clostridiales Family XIII bacterium]|jgi:glyoxylase-like metal-dependent hydrolase (beta-lactamase superfamily II)|nr:MBL fold metallo-hydrolase [Clostridiales Family XIII bacterium]